jgi:hypothetical protein
MSRALHQIALFGLGLLMLAAGGDPLAERQARIAGMSPAERDDLARRRAQFEALDTAEQQRLRTLAQQLERAEDKAELQRVMNAYVAWIRDTLEPAEATELQQLAPAARLERIAKLQADQRRKQSFRLSAEDRQLVLEWFEKRLLERGGPAFHDRVMELEPAQRARAFAMFLSRHGSNDGPGRGLPPIDPEGIRQLEERLSPAAKESLSKAKRPESRQRLVGRWVFAALQRAAIDAEVVSEADLARFFEQELDDSQRDELMQLAPDELQLQLKILYLRKSLPDDFPGLPSGPRPRGKGPRPDFGPGHPPDHWPDRRGDHRPPPPDRPRRPPGEAAL